MENQQLVSPSRQCSSTPVGFGQVFLNKEQRDHTGASPIFSLPGSSWLLPVPSIDISIVGTALLWCYWRHYECDGRAEKVTTQWLPGMFPTSLQSLAEVYNRARGVFWSNCSLRNIGRLRKRWRDQLHLEDQEQETRLNLHEYEYDDDDDDDDDDNDDVA